MIRWNFIQQETIPDTISEVKVDASFRLLSKNVICFQIWRIEEDRLEVVPKANFGNFYDDSCYIIYASCPTGTYLTHDTITREVKNPATLERFIHFWLGEKVTQQKKANVAHKVMELDTYLGNVATEYRESQDNESIRFMSYFKKGITIYSGALASSTDSCRLFQIRGRQWLRCIEMETISWHHFGNEYIMILTTSTHTFVWVGRSTNIGDRKEALEIAKRLQKSTSASEITIIDDGYEQSMKEDCKQVWNVLLPQKNRIVNQGVTIDKPFSSSFKLYKCGYKGTKYWIDQITASQPSQVDLNDSKAVYILNGFSLGVWMWIGKAVPNVENVEAIRNGRGFIKKKKYPSSTLLIRVVEGHEPVEFTQLFPVWEDTEPKPAQILGKFDTLSLSQRPKMAAENQLIDDGSGEKQIYQISKDYLGEIPLKKSGAIFFTDKCYVVQYTVAFSGTEEVGIKHIIYLWFGRLAMPEIASKCTNLANERVLKLGGKVMAIKMNEGDETPHFLQIFSGKLVILQAEPDAVTMNGNINNNNHSSEKTTKPIILEVHGDSTFTSKALQVHPINTLKSKDCYVIQSNAGVWVWCGQSSTGDAREVAKNISSVFSGESNLIVEGKEPKEFWTTISSQIKQTSPVNSLFDETTTAMIGVPIDKLRVHLYLIYNCRDKLVTQEILGFDQSDLLPENSYILDAGCIAFVWCGRVSSFTSEQNFVSVVQEFLETSITPRRTTTAIAMVRQQDEPIVFTGFFETWNRKYWDTFVPYEKQRHNITRTEHTNGTTSSIQLMNFDCHFDQHHKYPLGVLQQSADLLPSEVNPLKREVHLTHDDFVALFGIAFPEFDELPGWRKQELKKKFKLF